ncbi:MAG TPA: 50S ribosomal protein L25 [Chloroflexota bacterium]|nr:50S ribosomal protein L25 [Chloroflexota bacterium]
MAEALTLKARPRDARRKQNKALRRSGFVPLNVHGKGVESRLLEIEERALRHALEHATGSSIMTLTVEGDASSSVVVRTVQRHPVSGALIHAELFQVRLDEVMRARLPIVLVGEAPAVKLHEGMVQHLLDGVTVAGLPSALPHAVEVDLSILTELDQAVFVKDLSAGPGVQILDNPDELVVKIQPPRVTESAQAADGEKPAGDEGAAQP